MPKKKSVDTELLSAITTIVQTETRNIVQEETLKIIKEETPAIVRNIVREEIQPLIEQMDSFKEVQDKHTGMILDLQDTVESIDHQLTSVESQQGQMIDTMEGIAKKVDRHDAEIAASLSNYDRIVKQLRLT